MRWAGSASSEPLDSMVHRGFARMLLRTAALGIPLPLLSPSYASFYPAVSER